jgi:hypothetical protein
MCTDDFTLIYLMDVGLLCEVQVCFGAGHAKFVPKARRLGRRQILQGLHMRFPMVRDAVLVVSLTFLCLLEGCYGALSNTQTISSF